MSFVLHAGLTFIGRGNQVYCELDKLRIVCGVLHEVLNIRRRLCNENAYRDNICSSEQK